MAQPLMRIPGRRKATMLVRWVRSRSRPHVVVLGYHRVSRDEQDPFDLSVHPDEFSGHLEVLAREARVVPLRVAAEEVQGGRVPPGTVVVTLDDGYMDTVTEALPRLERFGIPATVFVTTGNLGAPFWWDRLAAMVFGAPPGTDRPDLEIHGTPLPWSSRDRTRTVLEIADRLRDFSTAERDPLLDSLESHLGTGSPHPAPRSLDPGELRSLAAHPLVEIGAHTVSHPVLARLTSDAQRHEIEASRDFLERCTGRVVSFLSFPNGSHDATTRRLAAEAGFVGACSSRPDVWLPGDDPFAIPRLWVDGPRRTRFPSWIRRWIR